MIWATKHQFVLAIAVIIVSLGYAALSFANPAAATALGVGFIAFIYVAALILRLHRRL